MSYSRWGSGSRWYTYWCISYSFERDKQLFDICGIKIFTYGELKKDIERCLKEAKEISNKEETRPVTGKELNELRGYMMEFISDIEAYKEVNFYEDLKVAKISPELVDWYYKLKGSDDIKPFADEAFAVLLADDEALPLMVSALQTDLGKMLLERRFKGTLKQLDPGAVAQLGERDNGIVEAGGSIPPSSI